MRSDTSPPLPIRGRHAELELANGHLAAMSRGDSDVLVVQGPEGAGVTRLLCAVRERAGDAGMLVCTSRAEPSDKMLPLGQLVAAIDDGAPELSRPSPRTTSLGGQARDQILRAIEHHLREISRTGRVIVCLDDVHLSDASGLAELRHLTAKLSDRPIGWLLGARSAGGPPELEATRTALASRGARRLELRPLEAVAVSQIAQDYFGRPPGPELTLLLAGASRRPGLLVALLGGLEEEGLIHVGDRRVDLLRCDIPARVRDIARDRLETLSANARDVARAAAVLGRTCTFARLSAMLGLGAGALLDPLDELDRRCMLTEAGDRLVFSEELLGEAIVATLPEPARRAVQRQAADVLTSEANETLDIATHLATNVDAGHGDAGSALLAATRYLGPMHPRVAAEIGSTALRVITDNDLTYGTLAAETAVSLHAAGQHERGDALTATALTATALADPASADAEGELQLQLSLAFALPAYARTESAKQALARAGLSPTLRARLRASLVVSLAAYGEIDEAQLVARATLDDEREAKKRGDISGADAARRSHALAVVALVQGRYETAFAHLDEADSRAAGLGDSEFAAIRDLTRCEVSSMAHGPDAALEISAARGAWARRERRAVASRLWHGMQGRQLLQAGCLNEAAEMLQPLFLTGVDEDLRTIWDAGALVAFARAAMHLARLEDLYTARARAHHALGDPSPEIRRQAVWLLACTSETELGVDPVWAELSNSTVLELPRCPADVGDTARFVRLYRGIDATAVRQAVSDAQARSDQNPGSILLTAAAQHAVALLAEDAGALAHAAALLDAGGRPLDAAAALGDRASVLAVTGAALAEQIAALQAATCAWEQVGAISDAARLRVEIDALHAIDATRVGGPDGRSATEADVMDARELREGSAVGFATK